MSDPATPGPVLGTALRYAAGDLPPADALAFETTLADSQPARDALAEVVRLSAAAAGVPLPTPDPLFKKAVAERVRPTWFTKLFPRRPYRGHPAAWVGVGSGCAAAVAAILMNATPTVPTVARGPGELNVVTLSAPLLESPDSADTPTAASPATRPTPAGHPRLNPMGMEPKAGVAANVEPTPDPMLPGVAVPMPPPMPRPAIPLPAANAAAEGPDAPLPPGAPKIGMM